MIIIYFVTKTVLFSVSFTTVSFFLLALSYLSFSFRPDIYTQFLTVAVFDWSISSVFISEYVVFVYLWRSFCYKRLHKTCIAFVAQCCVAKEHFASKYHLLHFFPFSFYSFHFSFCVSHSVIFIQQKTDIFFRSLSSSAGSFEYSFLTI